MEPLMSRHCATCTGDQARFSRVSQLMPSRNQIRKTPASRGLCFCSCFPSRGHVTFATSSDLGFPGRSRLPRAGGKSGVGSG